MLTSGSAFCTAAAAPQNLIPHTAAETAWENAHNQQKTGCTPATDSYCGAVFGYRPGETVAGPEHDRVLTVPKGNGVKYSMFVDTEFARDNGPRST